MIEDSPDLKSWDFEVGHLDEMKVKSKVEQGFGDRLVAVWHMIICTRDTTSVLVLDSEITWGPGISEITVK